MNEHCCGAGKFIAGMTLGVAAGTARMAAKRVNQAVDNLADAMDL